MSVPTLPSYKYNFPNHVYSYRQESTHFGMAIRVDRLYSSTEAIIYAIAAEDLPLDIPGAYTIINYLIHDTIDTEILGWVEHNGDTYNFKYATGTGYNMDSWNSVIIPDTSKKTNLNFSVESRYTYESRDPYKTFKDEINFNSSVPPQKQIVTVSPYLATFGDTKADISEIWVGGSDGVPIKAKEAWIGNSSGIPKKSVARTKTKYWY